MTVEGLAADSSNGHAYRAGWKRQGAIADLAAMPMARAPHQPLLRRSWELRENLTVYDAVYVALAEALDADLLTGDRRLATANGPRCHIETLRLNG